MRDINGIRIEVGQTVITQQQKGGILPLAPPTTGMVEATTDSFNNETLQIRYRKEGQDFDRFILLDGKINSILIGGNTMGLSNSN